MKTIYKYPVHHGTNEIRLPIWHKVLSVNTVNQDTVVYIMLDDAQETSVCQFKVIWTGEQITDDFLRTHKYLGTAMAGQLVNHVFKEEYVPVEPAPQIVENSGYEQNR